VIPDEKEMTMLDIALDLLALVTGAGESTTQVNVGPFQYRSSTTDYRTCVDGMKDAVRQQYPDQRSFFGRLFGQTDPNAAARGRAEQDAIASCGPPPAN
jgi:hypothetical protein